MKYDSPVAFLERRLIIESRVYLHTAKRKNKNLTFIHSRLVLSLKLQQFIWRFSISKGKGSLAGCGWIGFLTEGCLDKNSMAPLAHDRHVLERISTSKKFWLQCYHGHPKTGRKCLFWVIFIQFQSLAFKQGSECYWIGLKDSVSLWVIWQLADTPFEMDYLSYCIEKLDHLQFSRGGKIWRVRKRKKEEW